MCGTNYKNLSLNLNSYYSSANKSKYIMTTKFRERKKWKLKIIRGKRITKSLKDSVIFNFELKDNYFSLSENSNNISLKISKM